MTWIVMCKVSGGVTGTRESELKENGVIRKFDTKGDADEEAGFLVETMNHEHSKAKFEYWAEYR